MHNRDRKVDKGSTAMALGEESEIYTEVTNIFHRENDKLLLSKHYPSQSNIQSHLN